LKRTRANRSPGQAGNLEKRQAILAALSRVTAASPSPGPDEEIKGYYTLSLDELTALVNGDLDTIEGWMSHLDRRRAAWLLRCLIRER
jgi:hypothetical protein